MFAVVATLSDHPKAVIDSASGCVSRYCQDYIIGLSMARQYEKAIRFWERGKLSETQLDATDLSWLGWSYFKTGNLNEALALYKKALRKNPHALMPRLGMAYCFANRGKVLTVSGVIAAFRMSALHHVGFWDDNMLTEDIDITWKLEKHFWDVRYEPNALCWVLVPETVKGLWKQRLRWARGGIEVLIKHANIWTNWRQRRLWPIYLEYVASVIWSYSFLSLTLLWLPQSLVKISLFPVKILPPVPKWTGSILGLACLIQFAASICIDRKYERGLLKYYFWEIWYPFCYWIINALTVVVGLPKTLLKKGNTKAVWENPDRGIG